MVKWLLFFVLLASFAYADCRPLQSHQTVSGDFFVCPGNYSVEGVVLTGTESVLDCNGGVLRGDGDFGVLVTGRKAVLQNCVLEGYDVGVVVQAHAVSLRYLRVKDSLVGIDSSEGLFLPRDLAFENVTEEVVNSSEELASALAPPPQKLEPMNESPKNLSVGDVVSLKERVGVGVGLIKGFVIGVVALALASFVLFEAKRVGKRLLQKS